VTVLYNGKVKGVIVPSKRDGTGKIEEHPFFGMVSKSDQESVGDTMRDLRKPRYDDI